MTNDMITTVCLIYSFITYANPFSFSYYNANREDGKWKTKDDKQYGHYGMFYLFVYYLY